MAPSTCCPGAGGGALSTCQVELGQRPWATRSRGAQIASSRSWLVNDCGCLLANGTTPGKSDPEPDIRQYLTKVSKSLSAPLRLPVDKEPLHISRGVRAWLETTLVSGEPWPTSRIHRPKRMSPCQLIPGLSHGQTSHADIQPFCWMHSRGSGSNTANALGWKGFRPVVGQWPTGQ